jgi:hypothetical protein
MRAARIIDLFSASYAEARAKFLATAARRGLAVDSHALGLQGIDGETLATDVVLDGRADAANLLVVISGVHGVEGYCGSAIQTGMLGLDPQERPPALRDTAVLHVHAVNPYGFSHSRRATQENVDLNRNFIDFSAARPVNAGYAEIHELLLPAQWPPDAETERGLDAYRLQHGARGLQRAMSLGQYEFPDGLHYGGEGPTWSNQVFRRILRRHAAGARHVASIDIHTGLGPYGIGERIFACPEDPAVFARASAWWGRLTSVQTGSSSSIPLTGPIQSAIAEECPDALQTAICLEFGTFPMSVVATALRAEHALHRHGAARPAQASEIRRALKAAFYPEFDDWKVMTWRQGFDACVQALQGLQADASAAVAA